VDRGISELSKVRVGGPLAQFAPLVAEEARQCGYTPLPGRRAAGGGDDRSQRLRGHGRLPGERARPAATRTAGPLAKEVMRCGCGGFPAQPGARGAA
jgi:hypothetical protein